MERHHFHSDLHPVLPSHSKKPKENREVSHLIWKNPNHIDQNLFNTSTVEVDARGVIVVAEDGHLTETTQKLNTKNSSNALPKFTLKGNVR